jgi:hypothetical protein
MNAPETAAEIRATLDWKFDQVRRLHEYEPMGGIGWKVVKLEASMDIALSGLHMVLALLEKRDAGPASDALQEKP